MAEEPASRANWKKGPRVAVPLLPLSLLPDRKSDVNDAQWLQRLHACGLVRPSFRPERDIAALRAYLRLRECHLDYAAAHIQHMQKALTLMNR